jgi:hypothetical protein
MRMVLIAGGLLVAAAVHADELTTIEVLLPPNNRTGSRGGLGLDELVR